jgi:acyl-homoserine-lactone acylase
VSGKTDADVVFGVMYAQAEDDFNRIEANYLNALGRLAEAEGALAISSDLRAKLCSDPADLQRKHASSPAWLKQLMDAYADGLNYFLQTHPSVKPRVIGHFEPWMALAFTEGSTGGDIQQINLGALRGFYEQPRPREASHFNQKDPVARLEPAVSNESGNGDLQEGAEFAEPTGSNGIALAPSVTASKHAMLLINPHTPFFFRAEAQNEEGLDVYGAMTWGQLFVFHGFNARAGWTHTSSGVDNIDEYAETIERQGSGFVYRYGNDRRPVTTNTVTVSYRTTTGLARRGFIVYRTHHGPIREAAGKWIAVRMMHEPVKALMQSYSRMKAQSYQAFRETMEQHTNSSNNTVYADADGTIAYFHANFIPNRSRAFDWTKPVDGSDPATEWGTAMSLDQTPSLRKRTNGWLYNSNNWPWSAAGPSSPSREDFPDYVDRGAEESPRGYHALRVLAGKTDFTLDSLAAAAYDSYLPTFAMQLPALLDAWDGASQENPRKTKLTEPIAVLRAWNYRWASDSIATTVAVHWGEDAARLVATAARRAGVSADTYIATRQASSDILLQALETSMERLSRDFGTWRTPWGAINRFQRLNGDIIPSFDDGAESVPVGFTSSRWGSLASFGARSYNTKRMNGTTGNSFVAVVEFAERVRARAVSAGGQSSNRISPHFRDQAERYSKGDFREVYFYPDQQNSHLERRYHPGE